MSRALCSIPEDENLPQDQLSRTTNRLSGRTTDQIDPSSKSGGQGITCTKNGILPQNIAPDGSTFLKLCIFKFIDEKIAQAKKTKSAIATQAWKAFGRQCVKRQLKTEEELRCLTKKGVRGYWAKLENSPEDEELKSKAEYQLQLHMDIEAFLKLNIETCKGIRTQRRQAVNIKEEGKVLKEDSSKVQNNSNDDSGKTK